MCGKWFARLHKLLHSQIVKSSFQRVLYVGSWPGRNDLVFNEKKFSDFLQANLLDIRRICAGCSLQRVDRQEAMDIGELCDARVVP
jgi:hypothetical protein